jgi:hypothetical protein
MEKEKRRQQERINRLENILLALKTIGSAMIDLTLLVEEYLEEEKGQHETN